MMKDRQARTMATAKKIFLQEVECGLPTARIALTALSIQGLTTENFKTLYRYAHTLKGSGQMVGLRDIAEPAAEINTALSLIEEYGVPLADGLQKFIAAKLDEIAVELKRLEEQPPAELKYDVTNVARKGSQVLLVDDDAAVTKLVKERLAREGFCVTICHDTIEADQFLLTTQPDIILLDIMLPGENGIDFCRRFRSSSTNEIIPIIFFTVKSELQDKLAGFANGADDYLAKPFEMEELVARIHAVLTRLETLQDFAWIDEMTQVYNRRYLRRRLAEEIAQGQSIHCTIVMIDLNKFKSVNDNYGHSTGDKVLKAVASLITQTLRTTDIVCRYGGDEFVLIFPGSSRHVVNKVLERLKQRLAANPILVTVAGNQIFITLSAGIVSFPEDGSSCDELLGLADKAMYCAKAGGA